MWPRAFEKRSQTRHNRAGIKHARVEGSIRRVARKIQPAEGSTFVDVSFTGEIMPVAIIDRRRAISAMQTIRAMRLSAERIARL